MPYNAIPAVVSVLLAMTAVVRGAPGKWLFIGVALTTVGVSWISSAIGRH